MIAILIVPAALRAEKPAKPYNVRTTGVGASVTVPVVTVDPDGTINTCGNCFTISVEQDTDEAGVITTTMDLFLQGYGTQINFSGSNPYLFVTVPSKDSLSLSFYPYLLTDAYGSPACSGSLCGTLFSLSFTKNKAYSFRREGSEHGVCANGVRIEDTFKQTFNGADVTGLLAGAPFFFTAGQLSTFRGDPALSKDAGATPCVLP
jgi:hypothetical protein